MRYYPVNLDLKGKKVVVVGGGSVAARKALRLARAGADLTVVAPELTAPLTTMVAKGGARHHAREYLPDDLEGAFLVFAATNDAKVNEKVAEEAHRRGILVDVADAPLRSDFTTPALLEQGDLLITVSTGGRSPALAKAVIERLRPLFGEEYAEALDLLGRLREKLLTEKAGDAYNKRVFAELAALDLPALIKSGPRDQLDQILLKLFGPGYPLDPDRAGKKDPS